MTLEDREVTVAEAARLFGMPRRRMYHRITEAELLPVNVMPSSGHRGEAALYRLSEIADVLARHHRRRAGAQDAQQRRPS